MPTRKKIKKKTKMGSYTDRAIYELKKMNDGQKTNEDRFKRNEGRKIYQTYSRTH